MSKPFHVFPIRFDSFNTNCGICSDIRDFHEKFELPPADEPKLLDQDLQDFRIRFMQEELDEYREAVAEGNTEKAFDALIDLVYVAVGTAYISRFPFAEGWRRVHAANMAKIRVSRTPEGVTERGGKWDVVKPMGWTPPDLSDLVKSSSLTEDH